MRSMKTNLILAAAVAAAVATPSAFATNGYFSHGYGQKAKGMGGASTAVTGDTFGGANNPALMVWAGNRLDVGAEIFNPERSSSRSSSGAANIDGSSESGSTMFLVPEFGYNAMLNSDMSVGVTVYGNGGMNTNYKDEPVAAASACATFNPGATSYNLLCGNGNLGVDLSQLIIAPTFSMKVSGAHSFGVSALLGYQRFKAEGLQAFAGFSSDASNLTNNGYDTSTGVGLRLGWLSQISEAVSIGAAYATKMNMTKFGKYKGLFAEEGDFDLPSNYSVGVAAKLSPVVMLAVDYQRINYTDSKSVSNASDYGLGMAGIPNSLGGSGGRGFGWTDIDIWKIGVEYRANDKMVLRAGYDRTDNPIRSQDVTFNILAPGVVQDHLTLGMTYGIGKTSEVTASFMHAFKNDVSGPSLFNNFGAPATTSEKIEMSENSLGVAWATKW